ncbi:MAG: beta strand repeat-containing protein, partial [Solirubrobacteraceae bacterium]
EDVISGFEAVLGTSYDDTITGDGNDNLINGNGGYDILDGGAGNDTLSFESSNVNGVEVRMSEAGEKGIVWDGDNNDLGTFVNFENVIGSAGDDTLTANSQANLLQGGDGGDELYGMGGDDTLMGGLGGDTLDGGDGDDLLLGDLWKESTFTGSDEGWFTEAGSDPTVVDGHLESSGDGGTTVSFASSDWGGDLSSVSGSQISFDLDLSATGGESPSGITVTVAFVYFNASVGETCTTYSTFEMGEAPSGWQTYAVGINTDMFAIPDGQEMVFGTLLHQVSEVRISVDWDGGSMDVALDNVSITANGDDDLTGGAGDDTLDGGLGSDTLDGGDGDDLVYATKGDEAYGGEGDDTVSFANAEAGLEFILNASYGEARPEGGSDSAFYEGFETVIGTEHDDTVDVSIYAGDSIGGVKTAGLTALDAGGGFDVIHLGVDGGGIVTGATATLDYLGSGAALVVFTASGMDFSAIPISGVEGVIGTDFADSITGDAGDNLLAGGAGADTITGGGGQDTLSFEYETGTGGVTYAIGVTGHDAGTGYDLVTDTNGATDSVSGFEHVFGSANNDVLTGDDEANHLKGNAGSDTIVGGAGDDTISGGAGADSLVGGAGAGDVLDYSTDTLGVCVSLEDNDLTGSTIGSEATGTDCFDTILGFEHVLGGSGNDTLYDSTADNLLSGGEGDDELYGGSGGADTLLGGAGDDTITPGGMVDAGTVLDGGAGDDVLDTVCEEILDLRDVEILNIESVHLGDGVLLSMDLTDLAGFSSVVVTHSFGELDAYGAETADDVDLSGLDISGLTGGDGGTLAVDMGSGNDSLTLDSSGFSNYADYLSLDGGAGTDTLTYAVGSEQTIDNISNFEDIVFVNAASGEGVNLTIADTVAEDGATVTLDGRALEGCLFLNVSGEDDSTFTVYGSANDDTFEYGARMSSAQTLDGGAGLDTLNVSTLSSDALDHVTGIEAIDFAMEVATSVTTLDSLVAAGDWLFLDASVGGGTMEGGLTFDGSAETDGRFWIVGCREEDSLTGGAGDDTLIGGQGGDTIAGGAGADRMDGGDGTDVLSFADETGSLGVSVDLNVDTLSGWAIATDTWGNEDSITGFEQVIGSAHNDTMVGSDDDGEQFDGGAGDDSLMGGGGDDYLIGGAGDDTLDGGSTNESWGDMVSYADAGSGVSVSLL